MKNVALITLGLLCFAVAAHWAWKEQEDAAAHDCRRLTEEPLNVLPQKVPYACDDGVRLR
jgi:hypothetical protein